MALIELCNKICHQHIEDDVPYKEEEFNRIHRNANDDLFIFDDLVMAVYVLPIYSYLDINQEGYISFPQSFCNSLHYIRK